MSQSARERQLANRRAKLLARSTAQRQLLAHQAANLGRSLGGVERGISVARQLTARPLLLGVAAAALLVVRPGRAIKWIGRGALITSLVRKGLGFLQENPGLVASSVAALRRRRSHDRDDVPFRDY